MHKNDNLPGLYLVSTPIGNIRDITLRAIDTMKTSDLILCEDTRNTRKLLEKLDIDSKLMVYNDHSDDRIREKVLHLITEQAKIISLVSDAGTPLISDPGYKLVRYLKQHNVFVDALPGASAPLAALVLSTLPPDKFLFAGFLPKTAIKKAKLFKELSCINATLIFFESAHRIIDSIKIALEVFGDRKASIARELTKIHQEVITLNLEDLLTQSLKLTKKGEFVFLIEGNK